MSYCVGGIPLLELERRDTREMGNEGLFVSGVESGRYVDGVRDRLVWVISVEVHRVSTSSVFVGL